MTIFRFSIPLLALALAACGHREVESCKQFVKSGLKAPSTFRAIQVTERDEKVSWDQHLREEPNDRNVEIFKRAYELGKFRRIVTLEYEASNAFGVPIRSTENCAFDLQEGKIEDAERLANAVKIADAQRSLRQVFRSGAVPGAEGIGTDEPTYSCCE